MKIMITSPNGDFCNLEVANDLELENLLVLVSMESGKPVEQIQLSHNGIPLTDKKKTLDSYNVKDNDILLMTPARPSVPAPRPSVPARPGSGRVTSGIDWSSVRVPGTAVRRPAPVVDAAEQLRQELLADPYQMSIIRERDTTFAEAVSDKDKFRQVFNERKETVAKRQREEQLLLSGNPMNPEYQKKLYEMLQGKQIEENLNHAMEEHPESFGQVIMLYIDCEVNGVKVKAFVDSGAQMTLISSACADRCNVSRLIDTRFQGVAKGVGTQKILGRVHLLPLKIGSDHYPCTFSVLEHQPMDMLLGLDMLKRHQCIIDLKENCLKIGTTGTSAPFLAEKDIPKSNEDNPPSSGDVPGPSSTTATTPPSSSVSDTNISKLVNMGFSPEQSKKALELCNSNVELAASLLFEKGGQI